MFRIRTFSVLFGFLLILAVASTGCGGSGSGSGPLPAEVAWQTVGGQVSASDAESEDPVMLLSTPKAGYRHASFQVALNLFSNVSWGTSKGDPSNNNYKTFYGPPNFCEGGDTVYVAFSHSGDPTSSGPDFYDQIFAYSWDNTNGWQAMNGGNEISNAWPGNIWDAFEATAYCQDISTGQNEDYDMVVAWVEADNTTATDNVYVALVGQQNSVRSGPISRNNTSGSFLTDVRVAGVFADASSAYVAQWENDADDQSKIELYVTQLGLPGFAQTDLGGSLDEDYDGNTLSAPSMAMLGTDLVVAYSAFRPRPGTTTNTRDIYAKRWDGTGWSAMGTGPVSAFSDASHIDSNHPSLLLVGNTLYLAWEEDGGGGSGIYVASWDEAGGAWVIGASDSGIGFDIAADVLDPSLAYDPDDGYLYLAFEAMISGWPQIYVKRRQL